MAATLCGGLYRPSPALRDVMGSSTVTRTAAHGSPGSGPLTLWAGVLVPPIAWFLSQQISYMLVPWACATGRSFVPLGVTVAMLLVAAAAAVMAWRSWRRAGRSRPRVPGGEPSQTSFMALSGVLSGGIFAPTILAQAVPTFILSACEP